MAGRTPPPGPGTRIDSSRKARRGERRHTAFRVPATGLASRATTFLGADGGLAAIEFAVGLPVLLLILLGGSQLTLYVDASRKVDLIAQSISQMLSQAMPPTNKSVALVDAGDLHFSFDATLVLFPYLLQDSVRRSVPWYANISINYASIEFTPKSTSCPDSLDMSACYTAKVVWTSTGTAQPSEGPNFRPCGIDQEPADNAAPPNRATLPRSVYGPTSLIVVDVVFTFRPTFGSRIVSPVRLARSAYMQPRYASLVNYDTTNDTGIATKCPGY